MRWKIEQFIFCEQKQTLQSGNTLIQLEPLQVELLSYFCQNPDMVISREELIEKVWQSRIITDNAVNRVIAKLRKALQDDPKSPKFITTFPKKGYKLVASVQPCDSNKDDKQVVVSSKVSMPFILLAVSIFLPAIIAILIYFWPESQARALPLKVEALTRDGEQELLPSVSPDGKYLAYPAFVNGRMRLFIKDLSLEVTKEIGHSDGWSGPATWSDDSQEMVYLYTTQGSCQYYKVRLNGIEIIERKLIHNCPIGSYGKMAFTHDNNRLIYAENEGRNSPYSLFELNLATSKKQRLPQPKLMLNGNSQFDIHPTRDEVLISSPDQQQWLSFYSLNLTTKRLNPLFKLDEFVCCAIWDHTGERVVLMGEHPSEQLISFDLKGQDRQIIYQATHKINDPARFPNQKDYVYSGGIQNHDINFYSFKDEKTSTIVNSSVNDLLPAVSYDHTRLAYVSLKSGNEEIWLIQLANSKEKKLTSLNSNVHFFDLKWSSDGKYLLGLTINELYLIRVSDGHITKLKIPQVEIRYASFKDNQTVAYSIKEADRWQIKHYNILTSEVTSGNSEYSAVLYSEDEDDILRFKLPEEVYFGSQFTPITPPPIQLGQERNFKIYKKKSKIFYLIQTLEKYELYSMDINNNSIHLLYSSKNINHFDVTSDGIFIEEQISFSADIYRTISE